MSRRNVRVEIPAKASELMELAKNIQEKHTADGAKSPLNGLNITDLQAKYTLGVEQQKLSAKLKKDAEKATEIRDIALGINEGQRSDTQGTLLYYVTSVRDMLLGLNRGNERNLGDWGFEVNTSAATEAAAEDAPVADTATK